MREDAAEPVADLVSLYRLHQVVVQEANPSDLKRRDPWRIKSNAAFTSQNVSADLLGVLVTTMLGHINNVSRGLTSELYCLSMVE